MPILTSTIHRIDKPDTETPATLTCAEHAPSSTAPLEALLTSVNDSFHAKPKAWGHFGETGSSAFAAGLSEYLAGPIDFVTWSTRMAERINTLVDAHLSVGGHLLFVHYQHGETQYVSVALLHHRQGFAIDNALEVTETPQLNLGQLMLAARIDLAQWQGGTSHQYVSFIKDRGGKKFAEGFRELLGVEEGVDASGETRTLLKAFSDYVESEDLSDDESREKTDAVIDYANTQAKHGEKVTLDELSELVDEQHPKAFYDYIRHQDYGLSEEIPPDKRALNQFRRFTGRASGVSISFDSHLLGNSIEFDAERDRLIIKQVPGPLKEQLKQRKE
ncbi:nucleoid-associated protein YejK [Chromohalobacter canadensis]|uniref:nucleoid-associated protein YejK n=1 Tax=Chromohalobacter canadensis TaxID=141389 RepID=UPI0021C03398|nr:nucleoid-associated protein YejK [Chromohalobacter canadensis]MCT8467273.1 nucleoid-associated protein YejK [Chromohalobacter canadensis]MCT8470979.1 nucleoid-associated protein YejK [Chromohalobacter canadensis]MCT8497770.1 nucleoid-associated protein YejK [Chromohalobacter canadensis]